MVINGHNHADFSGKVRGCEDYIRALEEERKKIKVFQRELPLCLELVTQAIDSCKQQLSGTTVEYNLNGQSECNSDQTSTVVPVLEEFIPIKRPPLFSGGEPELNKARNEGIDDEQKNPMKNDWLRSAQLWNQTSDPVTKEDSLKRVAVVEVKRTGAFHPFKKEKLANDGHRGSGTPPPRDPPAIAIPAAGTDCSDVKKEDKDSQTQRKTRRCWSSELHRRFVQALDQLGGSHVATPKQIRELMKVDGLTNDEVKSHLQKYRLHTRRPTPQIQSSTTNQPPQFTVVVGGMWAVPPEFATVPNSGQAAGEIFAPIAMKSSNIQQECIKKFNSSDSGSQNDDNSPASSSSTQTTTASPPL